VPKLAIFLIALLSSLLVGRYTPALVQLLVHRFAHPSIAERYDDLVQPVRDSLKAAGTMLLISLSLVWLKTDYPDLHGFFKPFVDLAVIISLAWLISQFFRQIVRTYGIDLLRKLGREADELLLVAQTLFNVVVGFIAVLAFAQSQEFNLIGLMASLGIGGLAIAFAANKILEQFLSTIVLYLDRPFVPGDYIRVALNPHAPDVYGRIESIGIRSTKLRTSAKSTVVIIPNSMLANMDIENVTRGKKVMVMLYFDFTRPLDDQVRALVKQVVSSSTESLLGIDPGSTRLSFSTNNNNGSTGNSRVRITFFILGSSEDSIQLRKRLLQVANEKIAKRLNANGIEFTTQDPTVYVESPVTI